MCHCARLGNWMEDISTTPFCLAAYTMWMPLSIARPVIFPRLWSEWAPMGQMR